MSQERMEALFRSYAADGVLMVEGDPLDSLKHAVDLCDQAPDDEHLLALAVMVLDALLDTHWGEIGEEFVAAMRSSRNLRRCYSATMTDIPQAAVDLLTSMIRPGEDLG